ncbi:MAG: dicarboxylate/amino acid:cation symporter [Eubacteriaceae bacterium]|nr:dicarboxylate/amino acid:cation symporter [Eubacteriaceae bacterium]
MKNKISNLSTKILLALLFGAVFGIILNYLVPAGQFRDKILINGILNLIGSGFIRLMQMLVIPLVLCSLVCGAMAIGDTKTLGKVGGKTVVFYLATTAFAIFLALMLALIIQPGKGLDISSVETSQVVIPEKTSLVDTLLNIIPKNIFSSMASGDMLPVIFFAVFVGILLANMGERAATVSKFFNEFNDIMMEMTMTVMKAAPLGVFCMIAKTFATIGFSAFLPLIKYIVCVAAALILHCFGVYQALLYIFTKLNPMKFVKKYIPVMQFAFSTSSSNATIPLSIETLTDKMGISPKISSFTVPLGATINMDGTAIMQGVAVVFIAAAYGIELTIPMLLTVMLTATLASIGTAGVPGVGMITLSMVVSSIGLPAEGISLIMGVDRIVDMMRTAVNVTGDAVCTTIIAHQEGMLCKEVFEK